MGTQQTSGVGDLTNMGGVLPVASGGTGVTTSTGSGSVVLSAAPTLTGIVSLGGGAFVVSASGYVTKVSNVATGVNGGGIAAVYGAGRSTGQTAAVASVATFTPAGDSSYIVSCNVRVTTTGSEAFTILCSYTDEQNAAQTLTFNLSLVGGTLSAAGVAFANGAVPYEGVPLHIRVKGGTAITIKTQAAGTYTGCTYNIEGVIVGVIY